MITVYEYVSNKANTIILALFSPYTVVDDVRWVLKQMDTDRYNIFRYGRIRQYDRRVICSQLQNIYK